LPLQFHNIYSLPPCTLFSPAINFFPPLRLLNSLAVHFVTPVLPPLLPKFLSPLTAHLSSASICCIHFNPHPLRLSIATLTSHRDIRWSSQIGESTRDRPAFSRFGSSLGYNNCNPNRFRIEFELQFLKVNRILDHQSYIIDRVNLNIGRVGYCEYFIPSESDGAILLI